MPPHLTLPPGLCAGGFPDGRWRCHSTCVLALLPGCPRLRPPTTVSALTLHQSAVYSFCAPFAPLFCCAGALPTYGPVLPFRASLGPVLGLRAPLYTTFFLTPGYNPYADWFQPAWSFPSAHHAPTVAHTSLYNFYGRRTTNMVSWLLGHYCTFAIWCTSFCHRLCSMVWFLYFLVLLWTNFGFLPGSCQHCTYTFQLFSFVPALRHMLDYGLFWAVSAFPIVVCSIHICLFTRQGATPFAAVPLAQWKYPHPFPHRLPQT